MQKLILFLILCTTMACNTRERNNPLDPKNPISEGKPAIPRITAIKDSVGISWSHLRFTNATGFKIYRRLEDEPDFQLISSVESHLFVYWDTGCEYEKNRWYKISITTDEFESPLSDAVQVRPGPTFLWVADRIDGTVAKFSHDGRHRLMNVFGFNEPIDITTEPINNTIWVSDFWDNRIKRIDRGGTIINNAIVLPGVTDFAFDIEDDIVWVTSFSANTVARFDVAGLKEVENSTFRSPWKIVLNTEKNIAFLSSLGSGELIRLNYEGQILQKKSGFESVEPMVYDQQHDQLWLGRLGKLLRIDHASDSLNVTAEYSNFNAVRDIAIDRETGALWIIDSGEDNVNSRIVKLSNAGEELLVINMDERPHALAINPYNSNCFYSESSAGKIFELDGQTGVVLSENEAELFSANMVVQRVDN